MELETDKDNDEEGEGDDPSSESDLDPLLDEIMDVVIHSRWPREEIEPRSTSPVCCLIECDEVTVTML
eukprot:m.368675 g.368675  ORF g.368675 m.368675 type:complete len:68 (-) comp46112_c0_seq1:69-272(-)